MRLKWQRLGEKRLQRAAAKVPLTARKVLSTTPSTKDWLFLTVKSTRWQSKRWSKNWSNCISIHGTMGVIRGAYKWDVYGCESYLHHLGNGDRWSVFSLAVWFSQQRCLADVLNLCLSLRHKTHSVFPTGILRRGKYVSPKSVLCTGASSTCIAWCINASCTK